MPQMVHVCLGLARVTLGQIFPDVFLMSTSVTVWIMSGKIWLTSDNFWKHPKQLAYICHKRCMSAWVWKNKCKGIKFWQTNTDRISSWLRRASSKIRHYYVGHCLEKSVTKIVRGFMRGTNLKISNPHIKIGVFSHSSVCFAFSHICCLPSPKI